MTRTSPATSLMPAMVRRAFSCRWTSSCTGPISRRSWCWRATSRRASAWWKELRKDTAENFPGVRIRVNRVPLGPPVSYPVEFRVLGSDLGTVKDIGNQVADLMRKDQRLRDVHPDWGVQTPMLHVEVDQDRARAAGVTSADIARTLRTVTDGLTVGQFRENDRLIDIVLRSPASERKTLEQVGELAIQPAAGS